MLGQTQQSRGHQDLHDQRTLVADLGNTHNHGHGHEQALPHDEHQAGRAWPARSACAGPGRPPDAHAAQDRRRADQHRQVREHASGGPASLMSAPATPGPMTSAAEVAEEFFAWASANAWRGTIWVSTICAALPAMVYSARCTKATRYSQEIEVAATIRAARYDHRGHRQLADRHTPATCASGRARRRPAGRKREGILHGGQLPFRSAGRANTAAVERHCEQGDLPAKGTDQDGNPQPPVDRVAQQIAGCQGKAPQAPPHGGQTLGGSPSPAGHDAAPDVGRRGRPTGLRTRRRSRSRLKASIYASEASGQLWCVSLPMRSSSAASTGVAHSRA